MEEKHPTSVCLCLPQRRSLPARITKPGAVNFSSGGGVIGMPRMAVYSASKFAVEGLTESLAREVEHLGIRVTMIEPGVFETELGSSASQPEHPIDDYDATAEQLPDLYDWTPGDLHAAARAIVTISEDDDAPLRFYVGHGLDSVRRHYDERLAEWARYEELTNTTKITED